MRKKLLTTLLESPLKGVILRFHGLWIAWNEWRFNIATGEDPEDYARRGDAAPSKYDDGVRYQAPDYANLFKIVKAVDPTPDDVFCDIGCGKGRVLCVFARHRLKGVVGIELVESLCTDARENAARLRGRKSPVDIICADACKADLSGSTIFFFYNPFGPDTFSEVLDNIKSGITTDVSRVILIYYNAKHEYLFESCGWLEKFDEFRTKTDRKFSLWRGRLDHIRSDRTERSPTRPSKGIADGGP